MKNFTICASATILTLAFLVVAFGDRSAVADEKADPAVDQSVQEARPISDFFRPSIYFVGGELRGYKLYPGSVPELFGELGFQMGDLVTAVDGQSLTDPQSSFGLLKRIGSGQTVRVVLERDSQVKEIEVNAQKISPDALAAQRVEMVRPITDIFRAQPNFVNGQQRGYHLYPGDAPEIFSDFGLLPGDLLKEINGQPLNNASLSYELFKELARGKTVELTIERQGKTSGLEVQIE